ncbi:MAG TPA: error-prone DNA polymerase [Rhizomicrobium sp.]|jgi:error-prone DNA polymerase|nr:error-prone DNA polymerase [Rhizomicrobium sp.]
MSYAELAITTNFSFLRGASHPQEYAERARELGLAAIGIADRNTLAGIVRAYDALEDMEGEKPRLLVGARLVFDDGTPDILAYPVDRDAYGRLCRLLTTGKLRAPKGECHLRLGDLLEWQEGLLLIVVPPQRLGEGVWRETLARLLREMPGRVWLAAAMPYRGEDKRRLAALARAAAPLIAINDVLYHAPDRRELQDVVTCVREHKTLATAGRLLEANAERHLKSPDDMATLFASHPQAVAETIRFAARIEFVLGDLKYNYPDEPVPPGTTAQAHLEVLTWEGADTRYPQGVPDDVRATLKKELALIEQLDYAPYFLTVRDIVGFARARNILCQGRGSAANSAVCFVLGITAVDPASTQLLVERFISPERKEPPDIDVDFEHERREEVIQDVYKRYGHDRAALTATVITYRSRSAIREVGKVFGLSEDVTAALANRVWGSFDGGSWTTHKEERLKEAGVRSGDPRVERAIALANALHGFPRHLSQHVGGFVLSRDRLDTIVPIGPAAMDDRYFIEWDKDDIERLGIMKVDVLALGMLTCIRKAFALMKTHESVDHDLASVPREDPAVYDMLCKADAIGVFQVESRAQMSMLPRLKPRCFYDLVIEVAIVRPGPIQGNMVHPYLKRRSGEEKVVFPSPSPEHGAADELHGVLGRTLGVPLFQEQAMKLAIVAAHFSADEANKLRRAMATFRHMGTIHTFETKMVEGMTRRGYTQDFAARCFNQIKGFGTYGFPESHAASFAHLVYISAWIKCHHPAAFCCALLNAQPMGFYAPSEIVRDAREHGVPVEAPDVNWSDWDNALERNAAGALCVRLGFRQADGLREAHARIIVEMRGYGYPNFAEFVRRAALPRPALVALAEADALRSFGMDRREAAWAVRRLPDDNELPLFAALRAPELPQEHIAALPVMPLSEHVLADYRTMRLSLKGNPMEFLRDMLTQERVASCRDVSEGRDGAKVRCAGIVLVRQMPGDSGVVFVTLSDETGIANLVVWPRVFQSFRKEVMGARLLLVEGNIQRSPEGVVHLVSERFADRTRDLDRLSEDRVVPEKADVTGMHRHPRNVRVLPKSRDFH